MKKGILALLIVAACFMPVSEASAHVLVMDETKTTGAVLHIIPDDDPIAGQPSSLYFDMQDALTRDDVVVELLISNSRGDSEIVETKRSGSLVTATYTFPAQGVYGLTYTVTSGDEAYTFRQAQRVSRGISSVTLEQPFHAWAQVLLAISVFGLAIVAIVAFNRRKEIAEQSTF